MTRFVTMPSFARRFPFCIPINGQTDGLLIIMVNGHYGTAVVLLVHRWPFLHSDNASLVNNIVHKSEKRCKFLWQNFLSCSRKKRTQSWDVEFCILENIRLNFNLYQSWIERVFLVFPFLKSISKVHFLRKLGSVTNGKISKICKFMNWVFLTQI